MKRRKILILIFGLISLVIDAFLIYESAMDGNMSGSQSFGFTQFVISILEKIAPNAPFLEDKEALHAFFRKLFGHFLAFGGSGLFTTLTICLLPRVMKYEKLDVVITSLTIGLTLASLTEVIQLMTPGRAGMFMDILIDFSGYFLFFILTFIIYLIIYKAKTKKGRMIE